jgi:cell wall-associated NlpC family hydrolase
VIIRAAMAQLGMPYVWAAANPSVGFDCSGLSLYAYKKVGIYLPHSAHLQYDLGTPISRGQLQPGDLVFWSYGSSWTSIHHVAIWAGNGKIIEAADFGIPVHKRSMYWGGYFGAVRLL